MQALFAVKAPHEVNLPPMAEIQYVDSDGILQGGWWCISEAPQPYSVLVTINSTDAKLDEFAQLENLLYLGEVSNGAEI